MGPASDPNSSSIPRRFSRNREGGFSLTEVMVVLVIISIAVMIGMANFKRQSVVGEALAGLRAARGGPEFARLEAIRLHAEVCVDYTTFENEVFIFEDRNPGNPSNSGNGVWDTGEATLRRRRIASVLEARRKESGEAIDLGGTTLVYRPDGSLKPTSNMEPSIYFADSHDNYFRVKINRVTGGARVEMRVDNAWTSKREMWEWNY